MTGSAEEFGSRFLALTGHAPHPWQERFYREWLARGSIPKAVALPTGTGKTSIMALWLLAVSAGASLPRRLIWVVDRRVVVDQATAEAERLRRNLSAAGLEGVREGLARLSVSGIDGGIPIAISTLRGAFADNGEWSKDPSLPAIVVGTVDMVGSRLLFSGYGDGKYRRPQHAGLLGTDSLAVLDEAHLSRPFERLLRSIEELHSGAYGALPPFRFLPISATLNSGDAFTLRPSEREGSEPLSRILRAPKRLVWNGSEGSALSPEEFRQTVLERALRYDGQTTRVLVYLDRLRDLDPIMKGLSKAAPGHVVALTGTMRGHERDRLVVHPVFARFLKREGLGDGVAYLVATSAGEVGIDLHADQMVCDLVPVDRMIQRFGRVNRSGDGEATIDICRRAEELPRGSRGAPIGAGAREYGLREILDRTETYLRTLGGVSPGEIDGAPPPMEAFSPVPVNPPLRDWLLDAWSLTTAPRRDLPVGSWLRGLDDGLRPDVYFAWRQETETLADATALDAEDVEEVLQEYRLLPKELLREDIGTARQKLAALSERVPDRRMVVLSPEWEVEFRGRLGGFIETVVRERRDRLAFRTVLLPTTAGGLDSHGMLDPTSPDRVEDVSATLPPAEGEGTGSPPRVIGRSTPSEYRDRGLLTEKEEGWEIRLFGLGDHFAGSSREEVLRRARVATGMRGCATFSVRRFEEDAPREELVYLRSRPEPGSQADSNEMLLSVHLEAARKEMAALAAKLAIPEVLAERLVEAARQHDLGKARRVWQEYAGNLDRSNLKAKSLRYRSPETLGGYRHELGSLVDMGPDEDPLVRHLVATHHGYGRPSFPDRATDREHPLESRNARASHLARFVALQREYGWWGLAYLEALLKAADGRASQ